ncbi:unnamed protein product [Caenorhabditis auriculariae]|uniref:Uncharacterized protein n=1 Tax=Caenorhabditis auriculariae TaxID=2777116 RepID=A0A8S1HML9_9PELO|nr:unnamed protein product [Caenorhabditis auriculariae]
MDTHSWSVTWERKKRRLARPAAETRLDFKRGVPTPSYNSCASGRRWIKPNSFFPRRSDGYTSRSFWPPRGSFFPHRCVLANTFSAAICRMVPTGSKQHMCST